MVDNEMSVKNFTNCKAVAASRKSAAIQGLVAWFFQSCRAEFRPAPGFPFPKKKTA